MREHPTGAASIMTGSALTAVRRAVLVAALVLLSACSNEDDDPVSAADDTAVDALSADGPLTGASASSAGGLIWIAGGAVEPTRSPEDRVANTVAAAYTLDGTRQRMVELPIPDGQSAFTARVIDVDGEIVALVNLCAVPRGETAGCSQRLEPALYRLSGDGADEVAIRGMPDPEGDAPGDGMVTVVGSMDGAVVVTQRLGTGRYPGTSDLAVWSVDVETGKAAAIALPDGVLTPTSLCVQGGSIAAVAPRLDERAEVSGAEIVVSADAGRTWQTVAVADIAPVTAGNGSLHCLASTFAVQLNSSDAVFVHIEPGQPDAPTVRSLPGGFANVASGPGGAIVIAAVERVDTSNRVTYWRLDDGGTWTPLAERDIPTADLAVVLSVGEVIVDPGAALTTNPALEHAEIHIVSQ